VVFFGALLASQWERDLRQSEAATAGIFKSNGKIGANVAAACRCQ
jgi:hypothetical protein